MYCHILDVDTVDGGFHMDVKNGTKPENGTTCPHGFKSRVILSCNASVTWPDNGELTQIIEVFYLPGDDPCMVRYLCYAVLPVLIVLYILLKYFVCTSTVHVLPYIFSHSYIHTRTHAHAHTHTHTQFTLEIPYKGACISEFPNNNPQSPSPVGWIFIGLYVSSFNKLCVIVCVCNSPSVIR